MEMPDIWHFHFLICHIYSLNFTSNSLTHTQKDEHLAYIHELLEAEHIIDGVGKKAESESNAPGLPAFYKTDYGAYHHADKAEQAQ